MPRKKMPTRPRKKVAAKPRRTTAIKTPAKTAKEKKRTMPKKEETFGKKVGSKPRREITKRRQMEKDLLDEL